MMLSPQRMASAIQRLERLPTWLRPAAYGVGIIWLYVIWRGGLVVLPILILVIVFKSSAPLVDIARILGVIALATVGGAISGFTYGVMGRPLLHVPRVGRFLAGIVVVAPYIAILLGIVRAAEGLPVFGPFGRIDFIVGGFCLLFYGFLVGQFVLPAPGDT